MSTGTVGDYYIDLAGGALYGPKTAQGWPTTSLSLIGPRGATGAAGASGNTVAGGSGPPTSAIGNVGDYYIDTAASKIYGPKTASGWPATGTSLIGPSGSPGAAGAQGANGNTIRNGTGAPASTLGVAGDFYIDTAAEVFYGPRGASSWPTPGISLVGPQGAAGQNGSTIYSGSGAPT